jgi:hypothetical protein
MRPFFAPLPCALLVAFCCFGFMADAQADADGPTFAGFTPAVISAHGGTTTLSFTGGDENNSHSVSFRMRMPDGLSAPIDAANNKVIYTSDGCTSTTLVTSADTNGTLTGTGVLNFQGTMTGTTGGCGFKVTLTATNLFNYDSANDTYFQATDRGVFYYPHIALRAVANAPTTSAAFAPSSISFHGFSSLTVTIANADPDYALSGFGLTIPLPSGLQVVTSSNDPPGGCAGTDLGGTTLGFSGSSLAVGASCTYSAIVQGVGVGTKNANTQIAANEIQTVTKNPALVVTPAATATTLATACMTTFVDAAPAQPFSLTAAVAGIDPTGGVTFSDSATGTLCGGSVALDENGAAACTTNALAAGAHQISASYDPDANHAASTSATIAVTVLDAVDALFRNDFEDALTGCPIE